ncbi:MAG: hypothetical protein U5L72_10640 [Bacteroidales bacterium]|nr:hypothetical protein [Bacteroidales bacterium]
MTNGSPSSADDRQHMIIDGTSVGFGKRLEWPDDYFSIYYEGSYQRYSMKNYSRYQFLFDNGNSNLATLSAKLSRFSAGPNDHLPPQRINILALRAGDTTIFLSQRPGYVRSSLLNKNTDGLSSGRWYSRPTIISPFRPMTNSSLMPKPHSDTWVTTTRT